ncbi:MAG: hypothetical protein AAF757_15605, partial [Cyanobacteria bacterium P01_D01_bin.116]
MRFRQAWVNFKETTNLNINRGKTMGNVPFSEKNITSNFNGANSVASADVDGDGDIDILGAATSDKKITWWENTSGDGSTWTQNDITASFNGAWDVA